LNTLHLALSAPADSRAPDATAAVRDLLPREASRTAPATMQAWLIRLNRDEAPRS
jgi:hypothetical protein